jgi:hypothetical protein
VVQELDFWKLFEQSDFSEIHLHCTRPVTDAFITKIAQSRSQSLQDITFDNCGQDFSHHSLLNLIESCKVLKFLRLAHCDHLNLVALKTSTTVTIETYFES